MLIFSPGDEEQVSPKYKVAKKAGFHGADCLKLYHGCPKGDGLLDLFSILGDQTATNFMNFFFLK